MSVEEQLLVLMEDYTKLQAENKQLKVLEGDKKHPEHFCDKCGGRNITWYANSKLWNFVVLNPAVIWCPICFIKEAERKGITPTTWQVKPEEDSFEQALKDK